MPKSPYGKCDGCPLIHQAHVRGESNCGKDLSKVEVLVLGEAPAADEAAKGKPLIGGAGRVFRAAFQKSGLSKKNYLLFNVVLCTNLNREGKTATPPAEAFASCRENWRQAILKTRPKVVVAFGNTVCDQLGIQGGITRIRGTIHRLQLEGHECLVIPTVHPSYVRRNGWKYEDRDRHEIYQQFLGDLTKAAQCISDRDSINDLPVVAVAESPSAGRTSPSEWSDSPRSNVERVSTASAGPVPVYRMPCPKGSMDPEAALIDIQFNSSKYVSEYVFRKKNGKKFILYASKEDPCYCYRTTAPLEESPVIMDVQELDLVKTSKRIRIDEIEAPDNPRAYYLQDLSQVLQRSIDYYHQREAENIPEPVVPLKVMYFDIEIDMAGDLRFPEPSLAAKEISSISWQIDDGRTHVFVRSHPDRKRMDHSPIREDLKQKFVVEFFPTEKDLLKAFCKSVASNDPDILTGWNVMGFDIPYIFNRMAKLEIPPEKMSAYGCASFEMGIGDKPCNIYISGLYVLDMMVLYKDLTPAVEESYKLDFIAEKNLGHGKAKYSGLLANLYSTDINSFIDYSGTDTAILYELAKKLSHIDLRNELRRICSSTWRYAEYTTGQVDPLCVAFAKKHGLAIRNALPIRQGNPPLPGAFVRNPQSGVKTWVIDLDFTSLYPSIIISYNIGPETFIARISESDAENFLHHPDKFPDEVSIRLDPWKPSSEDIRMTREEFSAFLDRNEAIVAISGGIFCGHNQRESFIGKILDILMESRTKYKKIMNQYKEQGDAANAKLYDRIQWAYKILANSMYGVLANQKFRMFNLDLAKAITLTGQEVSKYAQVHLSQFMCDGSTVRNTEFLQSSEQPLPYITYGDTDSVFLDLGEWLEGEAKRGPLDDPIVVEG